MTGWTWDYIGEHMTFPRYYALLEEWKLHPPVHLLVAAYLGYDAKPKRQGTLHELVTCFTAIGGGVVGA